MSLTTKLTRNNYSDLVSAYALRLHAAAGDQHHIVSPLGAWLLLALTAPIASGRDREELERVLGSDVETARRVADDLLADPHPELALAFAAWHRGNVGAELEAWREALPPSAMSGPMPTQAEADAWASEHTKGQLQSMPVVIGDDSRLLLATAVATEVSWNYPFELVQAKELAGPWASHVKHVMRRRGGDHVVARTEAAGLVGVQHESCRTGLEVVSVVAAPDVPPARVIAAAYEVAALVTKLPSKASFVDTFDLPDKGHAWIVRKRVLADFNGPERIVKSEVTIPAWTAETKLENLIETPGIGFSEVVKAILQQLPPEPPGSRAQATQAARARFDTNGFSAAAVTVIHVATMAQRLALRPRLAIERTVEVRFDRPFAVVATTSAVPRGQVRSLWAGLPAFGAWVTEPMEPSAPKMTQEDW